MSRAAARNLSGVGEAQPDAAAVALMHHVARDQLKSDWIPKPFRGCDRVGQIGDHGRIRDGDARYSDKRQRFGRDERAGG